MLHGDIKMNGVVIGEWTAAHDGQFQDFRTYQCTLWYRKTDGHIYEAEWEMWGHHKGDGAVTLAERVLKEGRHKAKKRIVDE